MELEFTNRDTSVFANGAHLRSTPGKAHMCAFAGVGGEGGQARGHSLLCPSRGTEITDLQIGIGRKTRKMYAMIPERSQAEPNIVVVEKNQTTSRWLLTTTCILYKRAPVSDIPDSLKVYRDSLFQGRTDANGRRRPPETHPCFALTCQSTGQRYVHSPTRTRYPTSYGLRNM